MYRRLPSLLHNNIRAGVRQQQQQQRGAALRHYNTPQDAQPSGNATPLIIAGLLGVGGYVYYSRHKGKCAYSQAGVNRLNPLYYHRNAQGG
jgi:hypothetical protein